MTEQEILEYMREYFRYDKENGKLFWKKKRSNIVVGNEVGGYDKEGYRIIKICSRPYRTHRVIWLLETGSWPKYIDHKNGIKDDNRLHNLRSVSKQENNRNRKRGKNNSSGVVGVYWHTVTSKWAAQIAVSGKLVHLGLFELFDEAVSARKVAEVKYKFHENHGRIT